jgi:hypothetical protein
MKMMKDAELGVVGA